jgi:hypothetical protein
MASVDPRFGRRTSSGAAFIALPAAKPMTHTSNGSR